MPKATRRRNTKPALAPLKYSRSDFMKCLAMGTSEIIGGLLDASHEIEINFDTKAETVKDALKELSATWEAYENILTFTRATSIEGAMVQLSIIQDRVGVVFDGITKDADQEKLGPERRAIERLLYSIAGVLRTVVGEKMADHVYRGAFHPMHDPLLKIERGGRGASVIDCFDECFRMGA